MSGGGGFRRCELMMGGGLSGVEVIRSELRIIVGWMAGSMSGGGMIMRE